MKYTLYIEQNLEDLKRFYQLVADSPKGMELYSLTGASLEEIASGLKNKNSSENSGKNIFATIPGPRIVDSKAILPVSLEELLKFRNLIRD